MVDVLEHQTQHPTPTRTAPRQAKDIQADEIARDLALMDEMEAFVQTLSPRTEGRSPTTHEIREMAYQDREAAL